MRWLTVYIMCLSLVYSPVYSLGVPSSSPVTYDQNRIYAGGAAGGGAVSPEDEYSGNIDREAVFVFGAMITILGLGCIAGIQGVQQSEDLDEGQKDAASTGLGLAGIALVGFGVWMMAEGDARACGNACGEAGCQLGCHLAAEIAAHGCLEAVLGK